MQPGDKMVSGKWGQNGLVSPVDFKDAKFKLVAPRYYHVGRVYVVPAPGSMGTLHRRAEPRGWAQWLQPYNRLSEIYQLLYLLTDLSFFFFSFWWVITPIDTKIAFRDKTGLSVCIYIFIYIHGMTPTCGQIVFTSKCNFGTNRSYNSSKRTFWAIIC